MGSIIIGSGSALPKRIVTNDELSEIVDTSDEWIVPRTGIHSRRIAIDETSTDLGEIAALRALGAVEGGWLAKPDSGAIDPKGLDAVICMTTTPDAVFPSQAALIRQRIGADNAVCSDLSAACSGCVYGISTADMLLFASAADRAAAASAPAGQSGLPRRNPMRRILVVATERLSRLVDWTDRSTCVLFGDGAGAVVMEWSDEQEGVMATYLENSDDVNDTLRCNTTVGDRPIPFTTTGIAADVNNAGRPVHISDPYIHMTGQAVFKFATSAIVRCTETALARANLTTNDVALFIPHQANERIIRYAAKKMKLPESRFQVTIDHTGNASGASALIALSEALTQGKLQAGDVAAMVAFGGGLTAGAAVFRV